MLNEPRTMDASRAIVLARPPPGEGALGAIADVE
jgi:hypothetical protein